MKKPKVRARRPKKEDKFDMLARLIKEEGEEVRSELKKELGQAFSSEIGSLRREMQEGFAKIDHRLDKIIQPQLDGHAHRLKKLESKVFS